MLELKIAGSTSKALKELYNIGIPSENITFQKTRKEFEGDVTLVTFPFVKASKKSPDDTAREIGEYLKANTDEISEYNVIKGFLNLTVRNEFWADFFYKTLEDTQYGRLKTSDNSPSVMIEYPSPNTNKPLHLGHLRNIFLGYSISEILKATGNKVIHTCLYNDRGTNISKSMLAWKLYGNGETPQSTRKKGDHFVGDYYVKFSNELKKELEDLKSKGLSQEKAVKQSKLNEEVTDLTVKWENSDPEVRKLWKIMNAWVYEGFKETYDILNIKPDKEYFESDVYNLGKETVKEGLEKGIFYKKEDGSVWIDLTAEGLDHKLVLRSNGTTVYITQDIAVANEKDKDFKIDKSIYVVGNEQDYHFKVLFLILKKLGRPYADQLYHLSYGMVELPSGKMKSREGTVVDADDLIQEMIRTAKETTEQLGKTEGFSEEEADNLYKTLGLGALKYFILKVDPKKKMLFNPRESIDFNGHTGPFIQYTHARIQSVLRKAESSSDLVSNIADLKLEEKELIKLIYDYPTVIKECADTYNPAALANYIYELAKAYNRFYHDINILKEEDTEIRNFRLSLSKKIADIIKSAMLMLGIEVPNRM